MDSIVNPAITSCSSIQDRPLGGGVGDPVVRYDHDLPVLVLAEVIVHALVLQVPGDKGQAGLFVPVDEGALPIPRTGRADVHIEARYGVRSAVIAQDTGYHLRYGLLVEVDVGMPGGGEPRNTWFKYHPAKEMFTYRVAMLAPGDGTVIDAMGTTGIDSPDTEGRFLIHEREIVPLRDGEDREAVGTRYLLRRFEFDNCQ